MGSTAVFDILAQNYDADFTTSPIGRLQRERVWFYLTPLLNEAGRSLRILEINCGTGEDALRLASLGHSVMATDASAVMIEKAKTKLNNLANGSSDIEFKISSFDELPDLVADDKFDLVFSNFGGLNCIDEQALEKLSSNLLALTAANAKIFFVLLSPYCLWEIFYYGIRVKFKTAFRRFKRLANFTVKDQTMPVYYYSPGRITRIFRQAFNLIEKHPVGLFIPPSYLEEKFRNNKKKLEKVNKREQRFSPVALSSFADHYCIIFKKTATNA